MNIQVYNGDEEDMMKKAFYRRSKIGPKTAYKLGLGPLIGRVVLSTFGSLVYWAVNQITKPIINASISNPRFSATQLKIERILLFILLPRGFLTACKFVKYATNSAGGLRLKVGFQILA